MKEIALREDKNLCQLAELSNGDLLKAAEEAGFEVLLTTDTNLPHQQI
jgi:hypothetical protein